jgi:glyoxylase-like metal-dependent hydrolase (beta-lactamase superfamily II)
MRYYGLLRAACALSLSLPTLGLAQRTPSALVQRALDAMGGEAAARAVRTLDGEFAQVTFGIGQEETPESPPTATAASGRVINDFEAGRRWTLLETRPTAAPGGVTRVRRVATGSTGFNETNGVQAPDPVPVVQGQLRLVRTLPWRILLAAVDNPSALRPAAARSWRGALMDAARYAAGADTATLYFDRTSGYLTVVETIADDAILGDRRTATIYTRWTSYGPVKLPRQLDVLANGRPIQHVNFISQVVNRAVADSMFAIPDSIAQRARQLPGAPPRITVQLAELGPGIWRAEGGTHFSLVVEQGNGLVVVEAPQSAARMRAVFDTLRSRFPGKPVRLAVNTHHHWDHAGGLRETLARGIPILTHARNVANLRTIGSAPKTVAPDGLSRGRAVPRIDALTDSVSVGSGAARVVLYALTTAHAEGMIAAYVPAIRALFVSDVLSPGATLPPLGSGEIVEFARRRGITIERVVGGHGGIAPWADVERAAAGSR